MLNVTKRIREAIVRNGQTLKNTNHYNQFKITVFTK